MTAAGPIEIRPATVEDAPDVVRLVAALSAHEGKPPPYFTIDTFLRDLAPAESFVRCLVARRGGAPVGYTIFHACYDTEAGERGSYMVDLYVAPEARQQGLGRALIAAVARATAEAGGVFLWWSAQTRNATAMRFYAGLAEQENHIATWACFGEKFRALLRNQP